MAMSLPDPLPAILDSYGLPLAGTRAERSTSGLIQTTYIVTVADGRRFVAQRLHPIFSAEVVHDTDAVTAHLAARGLETPRVVRRSDGSLHVNDAEGRIWRLLTWLDGFTVDRVTGPHMAEEAGRMVARFHRATSDLSYSFRFVRSGVHDTPAHLVRLEKSLAEHTEVPDRSRLASLAEAILTEAARLPALGELPRRVTHGDLKLSNVLFQGEPARARALLDLDTLGHQTIAYELGDAMRSWCNPLGEDVEETRFDVTVFGAALAGYASAHEGLLGDHEIGGILPGTQTVALELAARFAVDAFEDRYFGWDQSRFPSRREHNRVRAAGQLHLARAITRGWAPADKALRRAFRA